MLTLKKFLVYWLPVLAWMGLIYFLSSFHKLQASTVGWQDFVIRKTAHFLEYFVLFILNYRGLSKTTQMTEKKKRFTALLMAVLYSVSDEFHQTFVSGRTGRSRDVFIDSLGALAGLLFVVKLVYLLPGRWQRIFSK